MKYEISFIFLKTIVVILLSRDLNKNMKSDININKNIKNIEMTDKNIKEKIWRIY